MHSPLVVPQLEFMRKWPTKSQRDEQTEDDQEEFRSIRDEIVRTMNKTATMEEKGKRHEGGNGKEKKKDEGGNVKGEKKDEGGSEREKKKDEGGSGKEEKRDEDRNGKEPRQRTRLAVGRRNSGTVTNGRAELVGVTSYGSRQCASDEVWHYGVKDQTFALCSWPDSPELPIMWRRSAPSPGSATRWRF